MTELNSGTEEQRGHILPGFGPIDSQRILSEDSLFLVISDKYPVSTGHTLICVKRAVSRFAQLSSDEKSRVIQWVDWCITYLQNSLEVAPDGFNIGVNDGPAAGQTVDQFHVHVIPRYTGDNPDPRGGVRSVIPGKSKY